MKTDTPRTEALLSACKHMNDRDKLGVMRAGITMLELELNARDAFKCGGPGQDLIPIDDIMRLVKVSRYFANYACVPPCGCHNCEINEALNVLVNKHEISTK